MAESKKTTGRKPLTEEEKAKRAENLKKAREAKKSVKVEASSTEEANKLETHENGSTERNGNMSEVDELKAQIEQLKMMLATQSVQPQVVQVSADVEKVRFLWQAPVADDNVVIFGDGGMYGRIVGQTGMFYVPKPDLSRIMDGMNRLFLEKRWLIVLSGMTDEERDTYGVNYKDGELIDSNAFTKLIEMGNTILDVYPDLCDGHKEIVAKRYYDAWKSGSKLVERSTIVELNKISPNSSFRTILEEMNAREVNE